MNKQTGTAGTPVDPMAPADPHEADNADPGEVDQVKAEQAKTKTGKYGGQKVKPFKPATSDNGSPSPADASSSSDSGSDEKSEEKKLSWIEIELVDEDNKPVPGEKYRITLPDNSVDEGTLDPNGWARVEGFEQGDCKITFPELDQAAWEFVDYGGSKKSP